MFNINILNIFVLKLKLKNMLATIETKGMTTEVRKVIIEIGENQYTLTESIDGKLNIMKDFGEINSTLAVFPCVSNVIELL